MRTVIVVITGIALFVFFYFAIRWMGDILNQRSRRKRLPTAEPECRVAIASDNPDFTERADVLLKDFLEQNPFIKVSYHYDSMSNMPDKLNNGRYAILLLSAEQRAEMQEKAESALSAKSINDSLLGTELCMLWNPGIRINGRNRVLNALEFAETAGAGHK